MVARRLEGPGLPKRAHRTVGPWCFADHFGPVDLGPAPTRDGAMAVGPHPHIGLQTVTWLFAGEVLHTDSVGSEQLIRPGQLNLMSAGRGISHAEESPDDAAGEMHGLQLWVAQPDATRWSEPEFQHLAELPVVELGEATATVLVGELAEARSSARADWPMIGWLARATGTVFIARKGTEAKRQLGISDGGGW